MSPGPASPRALRLTLGLGFALLFVAVYGGASALSGWIPWRLHVALPFEPGLPFRPAWSTIYLSLDLLLLGILFLPRWEEVWAATAALVAELLTAAVVFVALPVETEFPTRAASGAWAGWFALADAVNLERNFFPSLHVAFAVTAGLALGRGEARWRQAALAGWVAAIAASTVLIHEHHLADVGAGLAWALAAWALVRPWALRAEVLDQVRVEWACLWNQARFAARHRRYALISALLLLHRARAWRQRRVVTLGYAFLQAVDDLLDGDRACAGEPLAVVDGLAEAIRSGRFDEGDDLMVLARALVHDLRAGAGEAPVGQVLALVAVMQRDRRRALGRDRWEAAALLAHHRDTFALSLDLLLAALGSPLRADRVPELVDVLAWCSVVRDLREDLGAGLINVPAEVLAEAGVGGQGPLSAEDLLSRPAFRRWMAAGRAEALAGLAVLAERDLGPAADPGARVVRLFAASARGIAGRRYRRLYPGL